MPQQYSVDEFADRIRKQYPGAYDKLANQELVDKVLEKYPTYREHVRTGSAATPSAPTGDVPPLLQRQPPGANDYESSLPTFGVPRSPVSPRFPVKPAATTPTYTRQKFEMPGKSLIPTPRQMSGILGAAVGGAATLPAYVTGPGGVVGTAAGGALGYTGGTHIYDIINYLTG